MISQIWDTISNFGISEEHPEEHFLIGLFNQISFYSAISTFLVLLSAILFNMELVYIGIVIMILSMYVSTLILNYFGKTNLSKFVVTIGSPLWISTSNLLVGGFFSQSLAIASSMLITYVFFRENKIRCYCLEAFHLLVYFASIGYVKLFNPIFSVQDYIVDEIAVLLGGLGWMVVVLISYDKDKNKLINDLKEKNIQLKETTEELERFSYIASHDLKSPLRTITSFIGLIERDVKKRNFGSISEKLHFVKTGAEQMNFLVQDILELSKLKHSENSQRVLIDLNEVLEKAKTNLTEEIRSREVKIYAEDLPSFKCNEVEMLLLFQNFIQNGIKYNESKKPIIAISSFETNDSLCLSFRDNGIGIAEEYYDQIFQFFKRLHNSDEYQGTGLGLGLCKKIIKSHGGEVEVDSVVGAGSTFTIKFPLEKDQSVKIKSQPQEVVST